MFQLFLDTNDLNAGVYEGEVKGRKRFGDSQVRLAVYLVGLDQ
jgi:hypothetical protein